MNKSKKRILVVAASLAIFGVAIAANPGIMVPICGFPLGGTGSALNCCVDVSAYECAEYSKDVNRKYKQLFTAVGSNCDNVSNTCD